MRKVIRVIANKQRVISKTAITHLIVRNNLHTAIMQDIEKYELYSSANGRLMSSQKE